MKIEIFHILDGVNEYPKEQFLKSVKELKSIANTNKNFISIGNNIITRDGYMYEIVDIIIGINITLFIL